MHDTFLMERIYESLVNLCKKNNIGRVNKITVTADTKSHINENSLLEYFCTKNPELTENLTKVTIEKKDVGNLMAIIEKIEGESY